MFWQDTGSHAIFKDLVQAQRHINRVHAADHWCGRVAPHHRQYPTCGKYDSQFSLCNAQVMLRYHGMLLTSACPKHKTLICISISRPNTPTAKGKII